MDSQHQRKHEHFELNTITLGNKLHFAYEYDSPNLDDKVDQYKFASFEEWHPDFGSLVKNIMTTYAERLGFAAEDWLAFQPTKIYLKGLLVKMDFEITIAGADTIKVTGAFVDGMGKLPVQLKSEAKAYINGSKRKQGDLFSKEDVICGTKGDQSDSEEPEDGAEGEQANGPGPSSATDPAEAQPQPALA